MGIIAQCKKIADENKKSILSFLSVGFFTAIIYFLLFIFFWKILALNYNIAVSISYVTAILFYFFVNRQFTFIGHSHSMANQFFKFIVMVIFNYIVTISIVRTSVEVLTVPPYIGMVLAIGTTTILSYLIAKFWVFQIKKQGDI